MIYAILVCSCFLLSKVSAFGAGNIPSYGALEGLAFRHGDIEDILLQLSMAPVSAGVSGLLAALNPISSHGKKFNAMAVKRVRIDDPPYFTVQVAQVARFTSGTFLGIIRKL